MKKTQKSVVSGQKSEARNQKSVVREKILSTAYCLLPIALWLMAWGCSKDQKAASGSGNPDSGPGRGLRAVRVVGQPAAARDVEYTIESVGTLEAAEEVRIPARVSGPVEKVYFQEGDHVTPQTVLVEIDPTRYALEVERAKANLQKAEAEAKDAQQAYDQHKGLQETSAGWVSGEELRRFETALDRAKAEGARARAELQLSQHNLQDSKVKAPFAGVINSKLIATGEYVKSETAVATIADVRTLKLRFTVPEVDAARLEIGQPVAFTVRAYPDREFQAKVFFISTTADPATRMVEVKAHYENTGGLLKPGFFASVRLQAALHRAAVMIPEEAIIPTEIGFVTYVVEGDTAHQRKIEIGLRSDGQVEITRGLKVGEVIVVRGGHVLAEGMVVEVQSN